MTRLELIDKLAKKENINHDDAKIIVELFFNSVSDALAENDRVEIRGLFSFYAKSYPSYTGRNPKTGEKVKTKPKKLPFFKCGNDLKKKVDLPH